MLRGGLGADVLMGGAGNDIFDFDVVADSAPGARDVCRAGDGAIAFQGVGAAGGDLIDLSGIDASATRGGNQAFVFGGTGIGRVSVANSGTNLSKAKTSFLMTDANLVTYSANHGVSGPELRRRRAARRRAPRPPSRSMPGTTAARTW